MPESYQYPRVRLQFEQTRLLHGGERIGLVGKLLKAPSKALHLSRNLIVDLLLETQALLAECAGVQEPFEKVVGPRSLEPAIEDSKFARRFPKVTNQVLVKVFSTLEKAPQVPTKLKWTLMSQKKNSKFCPRS